MASGPGKDQDDHVQEPVHGHGQCEESADTSTRAPSAAAADVSSPPPPPAPPVERLQERAREQPGYGGGGAHGSSSAAAGIDRKGKKVAAIPSPTPSTPSSASSNPSTPFAADAAASGAGTSSSAASLKRVTWRHPVVAGMTMVPNAVRRRPECDEVIEWLELEQAAIKDVEARWTEAEEKKKQEEEKQVMAKVTLWSKVYGKNKAKVKRWPDKKKSLWSKVKDDLKNKFLDRKGRRIHFSNRNSTESLSSESPNGPHVDYETIPMAEAGIHYFDHLGMGQGATPWNVQDLSGAYSEIRPVYGDGECFYRSFIFSYLEQVLDRQDTDEERRLLAAVKRVAMQHAHLGWTSEFSKSHKEMHHCFTAFKKLIKEVMRWKRHGRWNSVASSNSYRKQKLLEFFSTYNMTEDIFVFLRLVTAVQMCSHREEYEHLITGLRECYSMKDWCFQNVTPRCDADHVQMTAFARALEVPLHVEQLIEGRPAHDIYTGGGHGVPRVTLLYTGHHYDIIYPLPPDESSSQQAAQGESPDESSRQKVLQGES